MAKHKLSIRPLLSRVKTHKIVSALVVLFILVFGAWVYQRVALEINKRAFTQARKNIDIIYADIVAKVGPPDNSKITSTCSVSREEFADGPTSCDVSTDFIYGVANENEANSLFKKVQSTIGAHTNLLRPIKPLSSSITSLLVVNTYYHSAHDDYRTSGRLDCSASYWYDTQRMIDLQINNKSLKPLEVSLGCSGSAPQQYYPLSN